MYEITFIYQKLFALFCFSFLATPWHMEFPGQGSDVRQSWDLWYSCEIPDPLTLFLEVTELVSWCCRDAANPTVPQWELQKLIVISSWFLKYFMIMQYPFLSTIIFLKVSFFWYKYRYSYFLHMYISPVYILAFYLFLKIFSC